MKKYIYILFAFAALFSCNKDIPKSEETKNPELVSIIPVSGEVGTTVLISGNNFSKVLLENKVTFDDVEAKVVSATSTRLIVIAPNHPEGESQVSVTVRGQKLRGLKFSYVILKPLELKVIGINPSSAYAGDEVTILGENFSSEVAEMSVKFDGVPAIVKSSSNNEIKVTAPEHPRGRVDVSVERGEAKAKVSFTYVELSIFSNIPTEGGEGTEVVISGEGFSEKLSDNKVYVGDVELTVKSASLNSITVVMPKLEGGKYKFRVNVKGRELVGGSFEVARQFFVETLAGKGVQGTTDGIGKDAVLGIIQSLSIAHDGKIWFTQRGGAGKDAIRSLDPATKEVSTIIATDNVLLSNSHPWGGAFNSKGEFFIAGKAKGKVFKVGLDKSLVEVVLPAHTLTTNPMCVLFDSADNLYLLNRDAGTSAKPSYISVFDKDLNLVKDVPVLLFAEHMAWNKDKTGILIGSTGIPFGIHEVSLEDGSYKTLAGGSDKPTKDNYTDGESGNPLSAKIGSIEGIYAAKDGKIYFSDITAATVRVVIPGEAGNYATATVKTIAGVPFSAVVPGVDGVATNSKFKYPCGIVELSDASLLVAGGTGFDIRRIYYK